MVLGIGESIELTALLKAHWDIALARKLNDFFHTRVLASARDYDAIESTTCF